MRFDKFLPAEALRPFIRHFVLSDHGGETEYKVFPSLGLVMGFQYRGQLSTVLDDKENKLATAGITGIADSYKMFKDSADARTILVFFTETRFTQFAAPHAHELFTQSLSLDHIFDKSKVGETEEKLSFAKTDKQRIQIV